MNFTNCKCPSKTYQLESECLEYILKKIMVYIPTARTGQVMVSIDIWIGWFATQILMCRIHQVHHSHLQCNIDHLSITFDRNVHFCNFEITFCCLTSISSINGEIKSCLCGINVWTAGCDKSKWLKKNRNRYLCSIHQNDCICKFLMSPEILF